jgi:hypothetical protein
MACDEVVVPLKGELAGITARSEGGELGKRIILSELPSRIGPLAVQLLRLITPLAGRVVGNLLHALALLALLVALIHHHETPRSSNVNTVQRNG